MMKFIMSTLCMLCLVACNEPTKESTPSAPKPESPPAQVHQRVDTLSDIIPKFSWQPGCLPPLIVNKASELYPAGLTTAEKIDGVMQDLYEAHQRGEQVLPQDVSDRIIALNIGYPHHKHWWDLCYGILPSHGRLLVVPDDGTTFTYGKIADAYDVPIETLCGSITGTFLDISPDGFLNSTPNGKGAFGGANPVFGYVYPILRHDEGAMLYTANQEAAGNALSQCAYCTGYKITDRVYFPSLRRHHTMLELEELMAELFAARATDPVTFLREMKRNGNAFYTREQYGLLKEATVQMGHALGLSNDSQTHYEIPFQNPAADQKASEIHAEFLRIGDKLVQEAKENFRHE